MKIIFLGAPGAGKGTQAELVSKRLGIPAISTGAIIREAIKNGTPFGLKAKEIIEKGNLLPDDTVNGLMKERIAEDDCKNGFILDGYPRTIGQAKGLEEMGVEIDAVVNIYVSDEDIIKRMSGRRVCKACGATYHTIYNPTPAEDKNTCGKCGSELIIRADDLPETVKNRLDVYHEQTAVLEDWYSKKGKLLTVEGQEVLDDTTKLTFAALGI
ncbi:MAG: adenylate kinase [Ruminococcaceae bacterium]|nr:adenylate kinase [Oscillospiraceae bacterium]